MKKVPFNKRVAKIVAQDVLAGMMLHQALDQFTYEVLDSPDWPEGTIIDQDAWRRTAKYLRDELYTTE